MKKSAPPPALSPEDTALAVEIFRETLRGMEFLRGVEPAVTMFGSARTPRNHPFYAMARATGAAFAKAGYGVITGGGPGLMEASNRGARDAGGRSVGCNITLPFEQQPNPYLDSYMDFQSLPRPQTDAAQGFERDHPAAGRARNARRSL